MAQFAYEGTVSHGTMRPADLIPTFLGVLRELDPTEHDRFLKENRAVARWVAVGCPDFATCNKAGDAFMEDVSIFLDELFDALNDCAPDGFYFGAHPGDGSDYGFWSIEDGDDNE